MAYNETLSLLKGIIVKKTLNQIGKFIAYAITPPAVVVTKATIDQYNR